MANKLPQYSDLARAQEARFDAEDKALEDKADARARIEAEGLNALSFQTSMIKLAAFEAQLRAAAARYRRQEAPTMAGCIDEITSFITALRTGLIQRRRTIESSCCACFRTDKMVRAVVYKAARLHIMNNNAPHRCEEMIEFLFHYSFLSEDDRRMSSSDDSMQVDASLHDSMPPLEQ